MAKTDWLLVQALDEETYTIRSVAHAMADVMDYTEYVPTGPDDQRYAVGVRTVFTHINGSKHYIVNTFANINDILRPEVVP